MIGYRRLGNLLPLLLCLIATCPVIAAEQEGMRIGQHVPYVSGSPYSPKLVPVRDDVRFLSNVPATYQSQLGPKALAVSEDGTVVYAIWQSPNLPPRNIDDAMRMALQHCEFRASSPCKLAAVADRMVASAQPLPALPKGGRFEVDRMPFWSVASIERNTVIRDFMAAAAPKALAVAPADSAKTSYGTGSSIAEARAAALDRCSQRASRIGINCIIVVEDDHVVLGQHNPDQSKISGLSATQSKVMLIYVGAYDCAVCVVWERTRRGNFVREAANRKIEFREVKAGTYRSTSATASWPKDIEWVRESGNAERGAPRFIAVVDDRIRRNVLGLGEWDADMWPYLQRISPSSP